MSDLLVRLYDLPVLDSEARVAAAGIVVRRALPPEGLVITRWVGEHFNEAWVSECTATMSRQPPTVWVAVRGDKLLGFACYDASAKGFFGPTGVDPAQRGQGIGEALMMATLRAMQADGYGYAIIGDAGPVGFYQRRLDVLIIPDSSPGIYAGMLRGEPG
jgi:GNAT superfamily N-acetyltransferase